MEFQLRASNNLTVNEVVIPLFWSLLKSQKEFEKVPFSLAK